MRKMAESSRSLNFVWTHRHRGLQGRC
jgi:hypothetical protein